MRFDHTKFFDGIRDFLKSEGKTLTPKRVDALEFLIASFEKTNWSIPHIAYALATLAHESAWTFEPIKEYRAKAGTKGRANQDRYWLSGFYGRGYVQLTWRKNYELFGIADSPDKALEPETAFRILTEGMSKGLFTGKKLSDFISDTGKDYRGARKIINGTDRAALIAGYANQFEEILRASKTNSAAPATAKPIEFLDKGINESANQSTEGQPIPTEIKETVIDDTQAKTVVSETTTPAGDPPHVAPTQVSQNGPLAKWLASGGLAGIGLFIWNYIQSNPSAVAIGIICVTALIVAIIFRGAITDAVRMTAASDPGKKNIT